MSLTLHAHPLASFCHKVLIALYEADIPFENVLVDLGDPKSTADFKAIWPIAKMPVLVDHARHATVPETSIIIEYLVTHFLAAAALIPKDADAALDVRLKDRFFDLYVQVPMQKMVTDRLRPEGQADPFGVEEARRMLRTAMDMVERQMEGRIWAVGDSFTMADCAAAPALFYAAMVMDFADRPVAAAYLDRLKARPSFARVLREAEPYFQNIPK